MLYTAINKIKSLHKIAVKNILYLCNLVPKRRTLCTQGNHYEKNIISKIL